MQYKMARALLLVGLGLEAAGVSVAAPCPERLGLEQFEKRAVRLGSKEATLCFKLPFGGADRPAIIFTLETGRAWEPGMPLQVSRRGVVVFVLLPQDPAAEIETALAWIRRNRRELGIDARRIALVTAGDSAGLPALRLLPEEASLAQIDRFLTRLGWLPAQ